MPWCSQEEEDLEDGDVEDEEAEEDAEEPEVGCGVRISGGSPVTISSHSLLEAVLLRFRFHGGHRL